jgi:beta-lactamase class A
MNFSELETKIMEKIQACEGRVSIKLEIENASFEFRSKQVYQSASLIKIPILAEAFRQCESGKLRFEEVIPFSVNKKVGGSGVLHTLSDLMEMTVKDLMTLMIVVSDNTATNILIDRLGMDTINEGLRQLGMEHTKLARKMMDFRAIAEGRNNFTSASDMIACLKKVAEAEVLTKSSRSDFFNIMENQQFVHKLPALINDDQIKIGNKTGELPGVEHDCAIMRYRGRTAYVAVLIDGLTENEKGATTLSQLGKLIYDYMKK